MPAPIPKTFVAEEVVSEVDMNAISDSLRHTAAIELMTPNQIPYLQSAGQLAGITPPTDTKKRRLTIQNNQFAWESVELELLETDLTGRVDGNTRRFVTDSNRQPALDDWTNYLFFFIRAWYTISGVPSGYRWFIQSPMICFLNPPFSDDLRTSFDFSHNDTINSYTQPATGEIWIDRSENKVYFRIREHQSSQAANRDIFRVELLAIRNG